MELISELNNYINSIDKNNFTKTNSNLLECKECKNRSVFGEMHTYLCSLHNKLINKPLYYCEKQEIQNPDYKKNDSCEYV